MHVKFALCRVRAIRRREASRIPLSRSEAKHTKGDFPELVFMFSPKLSTNARGAWTHKAAARCRDASPELTSNFQYITLTADELERGSSEKGNRSLLFVLCHVQSSSTGHKCRRSQRWRSAVRGVVPGVREHYQDH